MAVLMWGPFPEWKTVPIGWIEIMEYKVVNYSDVMFPRLLDFYREMVGGVFRSGKGGRQLLTNILRKPHFDPRRDLFIAEMSQTVVGLLLIISELKIGRIVLNCQIHHNYRYQGAVSALWKKGILRCKEIGGERVHICLHENFKAARDFFSESGFSPVRVFVELVCDLKNTFPDFAEAKIGRRAFFKEGEESLLAEIQNRIFKESWGFCPNTAEEIKYYLDLTQCRLRDILLLKDGRDIIGYLWSHASPGGESTSKIGRIHMFGITPEFRGRALSKKLMRIGLEDMKAKGFEAVELTVDEDNRPAFALYDAFGFREKFTNVWYEKSIQDLD
jgi:mycothiol synthase